MSHAQCGFEAPDPEVARHLLVRVGPTLKVDLGFDPDAWDARHSSAKLAIKAAVELAAGWQDHRVLLGRDFLSHFRMVYDGPSGSVSLEDPEAPLPIEQWPDE